MSATSLAVEPLIEDLAGDLAAAAPFAGLPAPVLKAIAEISDAHRRHAGETLFAPGQFDGADFLFVCEGRLRAASPDAATGSMLIDEVGEGAFYGLAEAIAGDDVARADGLTLSVEEDSRIISIDAAAFRSLVAQRPSLTRNLMQYFATSLANASTVSAPQEFLPERRVFAALLEHVERDAVTGDWRIARMPKHRELAQKAGAEEATAASAVARLIQDGVARRDYPGLVIADIARLSQLAS